MADKRRRARVQGGWASSSSSSSSKEAKRGATVSNHKVEPKSSLAYNFNPTVEVLSAQYY